MRLLGRVGRRDRCRQLSRRATGDEDERVVVRVDVAVVVMHGRCILNFKRGRFACSFPCFTSSR